MERLQCGYSVVGVAEMTEHVIKHRHQLRWKIRLNKDLELADMPTFLFGDLPVAVYPQIARARRTPTGWVVEARP
jgi:hypothetical protein